MKKELAKQKIQELVDKYEVAKKAGTLASYSEEETKKDFILPLFKVLGWNTEDKKEVSAEEYIKSSGRVDYGFYLNGRSKFYLEAKPLSTDLYKEKYANQAIRYSWNKSVTWAILTDFENIKVFNAQVVDKALMDKQLFDISYSEFLNRFDDLWLLSRKSFETDELDKYAERIGKKIQKVSVTKKLYEDLNNARLLLTKMFLAWNPELQNKKHLVDEGVQKVLDRIMFIRVAEDRNIEQQTLRPLIREWQVRWNSGKKDKLLYQYMIDKFIELNDVYNSHIFSKHSSDTWEEHKNVIEEIIEKFYGKEDYYEYDFKVMPADVLGTVYEQYLGHRLLQSPQGDLFDTKDFKLAKDAKKRKEQGIYYTPSFIVDYIVKQALSPMLEKCKTIADLQKIKVLDPACGSGSFLVKAFELIYKKYEEFNAEGQAVKIQILINNLYGVDLDEQAVEISKLNLLLAALEERRKLPNLLNIKNGNSLISGTDQEMEKQFGKNWRDKNAFNWKEEFPEVFKQGGFDVIVGNPPWVTVNHKEIGEDTTKYYKDTYKGAEGFKLNLFPMFVELALNLTKDKGIFSFIIPNRLLDTPSYAGVRKEIVGRYTILDIENLPEGSFDQVVAGNIILTIQKSKNEKDNIIIKNFHSSEILSLPIASVLNDTNLTININAKINSSPITDKIDHKKILKLKDVCNVHVGMMVKNKKGMFKDTPIGKNKIITGRDLSRYLIIRERYFDYENVEIFGGTKNKEKHLEHPKLFVRKTGNTIICSIDETGIFAEQSVYLVLLRNKNFDINFLNAILNSKLITFYFRNKLITNPETYPYIQHYDLENIPIIDVNKTQQKEIITLVDKMISLNKKLSEALEHSNEWENIKSEIEKTDKKIDEEVYKIYGLSEDDVKVIENSSKK